MEAYSSRELLCIPGKNKSYAIETAYVTELCCQIQLSRIPCMPEYYAGVCSYKGNIIPVIKLHSEEDPGEDSLLLAVSCGKYQLGILLREILISCLPEPLKRWKAPRIWAIRVSGRERKSAGMKRKSFL